ncbi:TetR/AcrR family transcriptional regulator [Dietzia aurantiaca]|uniref:TetR/AcrR family transcriptional regulator n=1 Tax=Dietzia aurantiaca TaxID=983873 RepID=UPI001E2CEC23|nr:TetR/AcrR family transcriptional regulator [Dietzia aurantiaca]MCD2261488.1 TetR/AcrR family transcriptional regulator [Dietzia aurantiaca]
MTESNSRRQVRWQMTRAALLDATVQSLVRHGYAGTTMAKIQEYAGVSRGSLTHHFPSMQELLVVAIGHVADGQLLEMSAIVGNLNEKTDPRQLVPLVHRFMSGPLFVAGLELWLAARTDDVLRDALVPVQREFGRRLRTALEDTGLTGAGAQITRDDLDMLFVLLRGLAVTQILRGDDARERRLLDIWASQIGSNRS